MLQAPVYREQSPYQFGSLEFTYNSNTDPYIPLKLPVILAKYSDEIYCILCLRSLILQVIIEKHAI